MADIHPILKQYWGFDSFRPLQQEIIESVLNGNDTLALMPTGGGKSLCYQVPALAKEGMCLVISPLIALMKDQVENIRKKGITAFAIFSGMSRKEIVNTLKIAGNSNCKFLYVSPERLETALFKEYLPGMNINLIAVDEAHCISQWGYDFRPPYLRIAALREELPGIPVLALTASATPEVQQDVCDKLQWPPQTSTGEVLTNALKSGQSLFGFNIFHQSFERPNLSYSAFEADSKINKIIEILLKVPGSAIIYCKSRKRTKEISELLHLQNISADYYHAGLAQEDRNRKQEEWILNKTRVIVCTNAFGMGIDKPDVLIVIHADVPDCLENYYQEAGRAGRDGKKSYAVLLYDEKDLHELENLTAQRFPPLPEIRNVYQAVSNYLQIPSGSGQGESYDFDIADFIKKFKLNSHTVLFSLKALEQEGWLAFNEQVFIPSAVQFIAGKTELNEFEKIHPELDIVIKSLLRAYEGIFDQEVSISEWVLTGLMKKSTDEVKEQLKQLHRYGIILYRPQKDSPQLFLLRDRIKAEDLMINMTEFNRRKEKFRLRCKKLIYFTREKTECRSRMIASYFGDASLSRCGICDNCLRQKALVLSKEEFENINHRIINSVKDGPLSAHELLLKLTGIKKEKAWKVIEFLQAENKIKMDKDGLVSVQ
ncbi:MAG: recombinase RecQ [Sphingobacteriales bacterium UTBCD1]|nr:MAG: recombinase RecQ [Sphingobacteriales bacterium UTBCD1]